MSKRQGVTFVNVDFGFVGLVFGAIVTASVFGACSHLSRIRAIEGHVADQKWEINGLVESVRVLNSERNAKTSPANVISCDEYKRLVSNVPAGSTIVLNRGTVVEGPCK